jgi:hypothetical protein
MLNITVKKIGVLPFCVKALLSAALLAGSSEAFAFNADRAYKRSNIPVKYKINPKRVPFGGAVIREAAKKWTNHQKFDFAFAYNGESNEWKGRGYNNVYIDDGRMGSGTLGLTWFYYRDGYRSGFDMAFNGRVNWGRERFLNTAIHEFGHALGLHHTRKRPAVMKPSVARPYLLDLQADDIAGAAYLYPRSANNPVAPRTPETETPEIEAPGAPERLSPKGTVEETTPTFKWTEVAGATHYELSVDLIDEDGDQIKTLRISPIEGAEFTPSEAFKPGQRFFWWVKAVNSEGDSGWGSNTEFDINKREPGVVTLIAPGGDTAEPSPIFSWTSAQNATSYQIYVRKINGENPVLNVKDVATTKHLSAVEFEEGESYYWWVRAYFGEDKGEWSEHGQFTIEGDPTSTDRWTPMDSDEEGPNNEEDEDDIADNRDNNNCNNNNNNNNNCRNNRRGLFGRLFSGGLLGSLRSRR